jgi:hypothetical protein
MTVAVQDPYLHGADQMIVWHDMVVSGPKHQPRDGPHEQDPIQHRWEGAAVVVVPEDLGLFDHVANSTLKYFQVVEATLSG